MNIMELINAYAAESAAATHAAMNYGRDSALYSKYSVAMLEARTAVVEAVEKLERDAKELAFLNGDLLYWTERAVGKGNANCDIEEAWERYEQYSVKAMEATNGQQGN